MRRRFAKMHGLGNDFVLFDATQAALELSASTARAIADRRTGIGCDQILIALPPPGEDVDYGCRIYNADGTQSGQCGNGARCLARFLRARGLVHRDRMVVATDSARLAMEIAPDGTVCVNMGLPAFDPPAIPMRAPTRARAYPLTLGDGRSVSVQALSMGNPHAVVVVADVACAPVSTLGPELERHPCFPERANVGFMALRDAGHIDLRVFERGVGETSACGSGACAAAVAGRLVHGLDEQLQVNLPGGALTVAWAGEGEPVYLTGPAVPVFDGEIDLP